jgi:hypothetical protein
MIPDSAFWKGHNGIGYHLKMPFLVDMKLN